MHARPAPLGLATSFGFGDRIGCATPGHVAAMQRAGAGIAPIFAQQSIREMARTGRDPARVMREASEAIARAGWRRAVGADADHLKTPADVDATAREGFTTFTLDPSAHVAPDAARLTPTELRARVAGLGDAASWLGDYRGRSVRLDTGTRVEFDEASCLRAAVKYGRAIGHACALSDHVAATCRELGREHEIELSVDETDEPTTLAEHWIVADRCLRHGVRLAAIAPRFVGDFEKGVDFKGDLAGLERSLQDHAAIARALGPYKLSLHSGSDKLSMYAMLARATRGACHVKTAGTSYLEAVRVTARHDAALFRRIVARARECYERDRATYHVSATLASAPAPDEVRDGARLERAYLGAWSEVPQGAGFTAPGRQILHCTFGTVLTDPELGTALRACLDAHADTHTELLELHFVRHLKALAEGL